MHVSCSRLPELDHSDKTINDLRLHQCGMRYAQPRKLKTARGKRKAALNAWCVTCRLRMERHGKNFTCSRCRIATRIAISRDFTRRSQLIKEGRIKCATSQDVYPFCIQCRIRMHRLSRASQGKPHGFRCRQCKAITASSRNQSSLQRREEQIVQLLEAGYLDSQIVRRMKCHHTTVKRLRVEVTEVRRCECGQLFHHVSKCHLRPGWQTVERERRNAFDDLLLRINRRVPGGLPDEMRGDICQEMLLDVMRSIDKILGNLPSYISEYKKRYAFQYHSFDANPKLLDRIAG